jgi:hypothetical protein
MVRLHARMITFAPPLPLVPWLNITGTDCVARSFRRGSACHRQLIGKLALPDVAAHRYCRGLGMRARGTHDVEI